MNEIEVASLIWHNGNIQLKENFIFNSNFDFLFCNNLIGCFFTSGTEILFFEETFSRFQSFYDIYNFGLGLFAEETGDTFKNETKRLLIRNKYYKTARCYVLISRCPKTDILNEFIFLVPDSQLFGIYKTIKKTIVSNRFLKPTGIAMKLPSLENEFRKIIYTEIENEKVDDCIILNQDHHIVETYLGNIFLINPGLVFTPSLSSGCSSGLLRNIIISIFGQLNFKVIEKSDLLIENLFEANEVIVAGETGVYSLKGIEYKRYFDNVKKLVLSKIIETGLD